MCFCNLLFKNENIKPKTKKKFKKKTCTENDFKKSYVQNNFYVYTIHMYMYEL